jgi:serine/threonine-protein kinase
MRADLLRAAAGRPVSAPPVMTEAERTAMMPPPQRPVGPPTRSAARVAERNQQRKSNTAIVVLITVLGMLAFGALGVGLYLANQNNDVRVPDLIGKSQADAQLELTRDGLTPKPSQAAANVCTTDKFNKVVSQNPAANASLKKGGEVAFEFCLPPDKKAVPPILGMTKDQADAALKERGLTARFDQVSSGQPVDTVVDSNPKPGADVPVNSVVVVQISKFDQRQVPPLSGLTPEQAKSELAAKGLDPNKLTVKYQPTPNESDVGKVISQNPSAGQTVAKNTAITVVVGQKLAPSTSGSSSGSSSGPGTTA